jgi:hypothetical protein
VLLVVVLRKSQDVNHVSPVHRVRFVVVKQNIAENLNADPVSLAKKDKSVAVLPDIARERNLSVNLANPVKQDKSVAVLLDIATNENPPRKFQLKRSRRQRNLPLKNHLLRNL